MAILWGWSSFHEDSPLFIKAAIFTRMESVVEGKLGKGDSRLNEIPFHPSRLFANPHVKIAENLPSSSRLFSQTFRTTTSKTWRKQVRNSNISIRFGFFERYIFLSLFFFFADKKLRRKRSVTIVYRRKYRERRRGAQGFWIISIVNNNDGLPVERFAAVLFEPEHHGDGIVRLTGLYIAGQSCPLSCHSLYRLHGYCNTHGRWGVEKFFFFPLSSERIMTWRDIMRFFREKEGEKENSEERVKFCPAQLVKMNFAVFPFWSRNETYRRSV